MANELPFTPAIQVNDVLYCSGQIGLDKDDNLVEGLAAQIRQAFANLEELLAEHGSSLDRVVKSTVLLSDIEDYGEMNEVYAECFGSTKPARSAFAVAALPLGAKFELEVIARLG